MIDETIDNGESEVQIATIGKVIGTDINGNAVEQNFTEESLKTIANTQMEEILVDVDHQSEKSDDTSAKGWLSNLKFVPGKGLFGKIKWTNLGKMLIQNRVFRWLSPSWILNDLTMEPIEMTSCALTNRPSQLGRIEPIVNSSPIEQQNLVEQQNFDINKDILKMTKEELKQLIIEVLAEIENEKSVKDEEKETVEETKVEETKVEETVENNACEETKEEEKEVVIVKEEKPEAINECETKTEETKKEDEVIKIETLNSAPVEVEPIWKKLTGKAFRDYIENGMYK